MITTAKPVPRALAILASLATAGIAQAAEPTPPATGASAPATVERCPQRMPCAERRREQLTELRTALQLQPGQEASWDAGAALFQGDDGRLRHQHQADWATLPVVERLEKQLAFKQARLRQLEARLAATRTFYGSLTAAQRKTFDPRFRPWPEHPGPGKSDGSGPQG